MPAFQTRFFNDAVPGLCLFSGLKPRTSSLSVLRVHCGSAFTRRDRMKSQQGGSGDCRAGPSRDDEPDPAFRAIPHVSFNEPLSLSLSIPRSANGSSLRNSLSTFLSQPLFADQP
jgi:hypothetical protein